MRGRQTVTIEVGKTVRLEIELKANPSITGIVRDPNGQPAIFIFKTVSEAHVGELSFFKVYSGSIAPGMDLVNEANNKPEHLKLAREMADFIRNGAERSDEGGLGRWRGSHQ